jgi:hypothetical protein
MLSEYRDWPYLGQVLKVVRRRTTKLKETEEVAYTISSLPAEIADARRLLALGRGHWRIENGLHYRRYGSLGEDRCQARRGTAPQVLAGLNNLVCHDLRGPLLGGRFGGLAAPKPPPRNSWCAGYVGGTGCATWQNYSGSVQGELTNGLSKYSVRMSPRSARKLARDAGSPHLP